MSVDLTFYCKCKRAAKSLISLAKGWPKVRPFAYCLLPYSANMLIATYDPSTHVVCYLYVFI